MVFYINGVKGFSVSSVNNVNKTMCFFTSLSGEFRVLKIKYNESQIKFLYSFDGLVIIL